MTIFESCSLSIAKNKTNSLSNGVRLNTKINKKLETEMSECFLPMCIKYMKQYSVLRM